MGETRLAKNWEADDVESGEETPTTLAEQPWAGPHEAPSSSHPDLDAGLRALGMLSASTNSNTQSPAASLPLRPQRNFEEGVEGADDVVVVERVSPEEEERRYFQMM